ncbi:MAG: hypothetical protein RL376_1474 [Verrucomicrobiota bacterium]
MPSATPSAHPSDYGAQLTRALGTITRAARPQELNAWRDALPAIADRVGRSLLHSPDLHDWLGSADPTELPSLIKHHGLLWHAALSLHSAAALQAELLRAYASLLNRGFSFDYFVAEFLAWQAALAAELPDGAPRIVAFFERLLELHPLLVAAATEHMEDLPPLRQASRRALDAVLSPDEELLVTCLRGQRKPAMRREIVTEVMHRVGALWADGSIDVATEHAATALMSRALHRFSTEPAPRRAHARHEPSEKTASEKPRVMIALPAGERHEMAALLLREALVSEGYPVTYTGADLPLHSVATWLSMKPAEVLIIPAVILHHLPPTMEMIRRARAACPEIQVVVGGQAYTADPQLWRTVGADICLQTIPDLVSWLRAFTKLIGRAPAKALPRPAHAIQQIG